MGSRVLLPVRSIRGRVQRDERARFTVRLSFLRSAVLGSNGGLNCGQLPVGPRGPGQSDTLDHFHPRANTLDNISDAGRLGISGVAELVHTGIGECGGHRERERAGGLRIVEQLDLLGA